MAATNLIEKLAEDVPVLSDGAWGTQLQSRGLKAGEMADLWNLSYPDRVEDVARSYVEAGSQVILTNTFRANRIAMAKHPDVDKIAEINRAGAAISLRAAVGRAKVFASIGPSGKMLLTGEVSEADLRAAFEEQAGALAGAGVDALIIETMSDINEACIAVASAVSTGLPVVACMVFDSGKNKDRTMMGVSPEQAASQLSAVGAAAVGANCGIGIEQAVAVSAALSGASQLPVWIKPNAGLPEIEKGEVVYRTTPREFAGFLPALLEAGASFVGGCCGSSPEFIRALKAQKQDSMCGAAEVT